MNNANSKLTSFQRTVLACCVGPFIALSIHFGNGSFCDIGDGLAIVMLGLAVLNQCLALSAVIAACSIFLSDSRQPKSNLTILGGTAVLVALSFCKNVGSLANMSASFSGATLIILQAAFVWLSLELTFEFLNLTGKCRRLVPVGTSVTFALVALISTDDSLASLGIGSGAIAIEREIAVILATMTAIYLCFRTMPIHLYPGNFRRALTVQIGGKNSFQWLLIKLAILGFSPIASVSVLILMENISGSSLVDLIPMITPFTCAGTLILTWSRINRLLDERLHDDFMIHSVPVAMKTFLLRHVDQSKNWATVVGMKTAEYLVDHDPSGVFNRGLPATLMQIRTEEIRRFVGQSLQDKILHQDVVRNQIAGTINPEKSVHPCIDSLRFISCLYLDANSLIEQRLKGITALLPLIDPSLAVNFSKQVVNDITLSNDWFFYLDFSWIDQFVIQYHDRSQYGVSLNPLEFHYRKAMVETSKSLGQIGSVIWLSEAARNQIIKESQVVASIIESCPIKLSLDLEDELFFLIRFEQLVPRLQKFYGLDKLRQRTSDFEMSNQASRIRDEILKKIRAARSQNELEGLVSAVLSYDWHGFKEKNSALSLLMNMWLDGEKMVEKVGGGLDRFRQILITAVQKIGYPSQGIHLAQMDKRLLRDHTRIISAARDPRNPRFFEAWMILSVKDFSNDPPAEKAILSDFLISIIKDGKIEPDATTAPRVLDTFIQFALSDNRTKAGLLFENFPELVRWYCHREESLEHLAYLLDRIQYIEQEFKQRIQLDSALIESIIVQLGQRRSLSIVEDYDAKFLEMRLRNYEVKSI